MDPAQPTFVHSYLLNRHGGGAAIDEQAVAAWTPSAGMLWVHLEVQNSRAQEWTRDQAGLDPLIADTLLAGETRPRTIIEDSGLLVILRGVNMNPGADPEDMVSVRIWLERDRIITTRRRRLLSVQDVRAATDAGHGPKSAGEFLVMLVERLAERIGKVVGEIEDEIDTIEERAEAAEIRAVQSEIGVLRRQTAAVRRYLAPQRDALIRVRGNTDLLSGREIYELEDQSDRTTRYLEDLDLARERALLTQEQLANRLAQEQNARLYLLSIVAAIFLPLSFLTGLLGMNVAGLPGTESPSGFLIAALSMAGIGIGLLGYFRWKKWI